MGYVLLGIALLFNASANILMKLGAKKMKALDLGAIGLAELVPKLLTNYYMILGLVLFASNVIFYFLALRSVNLSIGYPIMTVGGLLIITIFSLFFLSESLTKLQLGGLALIAVGLVCLAAHAS